MDLPLPLLANLPRCRRQLLPVPNIPENPLPLVPAVHDVLLSSQVVKITISVSCNGVVGIERDVHRAHRVATGIGNVTRERVF
jgi:hypothetical protein